MLVCRLAVARVVLVACVAMCADVSISDEFAAPIHPGDLVRGIPFWTERATFFRHAPAFGFAPVPGAKGYRFTVSGKGGLRLGFTAARSDAALSEIWDRLPSDALYKVRCEGIGAEGKTIALSGERSFTKTSPFRKDCPPKVRGYGEAAEGIFGYITSLDGMTGLLKTGIPSSSYQHNAYVSKTHTAHIRAMLAWAAANPARKEFALKFAKASAEYLLSQLEPASAPLAFWPPTYGRKPLAYDPKTDGGEKHWAMVGNDPEAAANNRGQVMTLYPADVGCAFVQMYQVAGDARYLQAAIGIAETYLRIRRKDGSWSLKYRLATGEEIGRNTLVPTRPMQLFDALAETTDEVKWKDAAEACFAWIEKGPLSDWNWDGQFEDIEPKNRYRNLTKHNAIEAMFYLLRHRPDDSAARRLARELLRWSEDQFVFWKCPAAEGARVPHPGSLDPNFRPAIYRYPSAFEQYDCYDAIDSSAAKMIQAYLAMWRVGHDPLDLAKACALGDSMTRQQKASGRLPTFWAEDGFLLTTVRYDWLNCMESSAMALLALDSATRRADVRRR